MDNKNDTHVGTGLKAALAGFILLVVFFAGGIFILPMLQTVGGSFGYGYPGTSGGRAIRDVVIDVEPQVVYRIDDHRFFTFENYLDCEHGGFVYYNDTNKKIKVFAGIEGQHKKPQTEVSVSQRNNILSYNGRFIYAADDSIIAYPDRNVSYKYSSSDFFIYYKSIKNPTKKAMISVLSSFNSTVVITSSDVYVNDAGVKYEKHEIPKTKDGGKWVDSTEVQFKSSSKDDRFHCDKMIKPREIKYISK